MITRSEGLIIIHIKEYINRPLLRKRSIRQFSFHSYSLRRGGGETVKEGRRRDKKLAFVFNGEKIASLESVLKLLFKKRIFKALLLA